MLYVLYSVLQKHEIVKHDIDIKEYPDHFLFVCDIPGLRASDVKASMITFNQMLILWPHQE